MKSYVEYERFDRSVEDKIFVYIETDRITRPSRFPSIIKFVNYICLIAQNFIFHIYIYIWISYNEIHPSLDAI